VRTIELDASGWKTPIDFITALQNALKAPEWCGSNVDAINELMVWGLDAGELAPPYVVNIVGTSLAPEEVRDYIALQARCVQDARAEMEARYGTDVNVSINF
jgi:hypothetical protein